MGHLYIPGSRVSQVSSKSSLSCKCWRNATPRYDVSTMKVTFSSNYFRCRHSFCPGRWIDFLAGLLRCHDCRLNLNQACVQLISVDQKAVLGSFLLRSVNLSSNASRVARKFTLHVSRLDPLFETDEVFQIRCYAATTEEAIEFLRVLMLAKARLNLPSGSHYNLPESSKSR